MSETKRCPQCGSVEPGILARGNGINANGGVCPDPFHDPDSEHSERRRWTIWVHKSGWVESATDLRPPTGNPESWERVEVVETRGEE